MLVSEFYDRTGVWVDAVEYADIEEMYYHFEGNKDEFCKWWCNENKERVKASKDAEKAAKEAYKKIERFELVLYKAISTKRNALSFDLNRRFERAYMESYIIRFANAAKIDVYEVIEMASKYLNYRVFNHGSTGILLYRLSNVTI